MSVEITRYDLLAPELKEDLACQDAIIFTERIENAPEWAHPDWEVVVYEGEQWVSALELFEQTINVSGHAIRVCGIGGVKTRPEYRRRGYAEEAMRVATQFMCEELQVPFGFLVCGPHLVDYYGRLGWQRIDVTVYHRQEKGRFAFPQHIHALIYPCGSTAWPEGDVDLMGLPW